MSSLVTAELGTKENPHPTLPPVKDRIIGHYYIYKGQIRKQKKCSGRKNGKLSRDPKAYKKSQMKYSQSNKRKEYLKRYMQTKAYIEYQTKYRQSNNRKKSLEKYNRSDKRKKVQKKYEQSEKGKKKRKERTKDPLYRLRQNMRTRVIISLKSQNASKNQRTMEYVNCSVAHLHNHIESQFKDSGMNWDNMGREDGEGGRGWEVDHRRPCASFDLSDEEQKYMCFHWTNLQPMWGQENNEKSDKFDPETFPYKWIDRETGWVGIPTYIITK